MANNPLQQLFGSMMNGGSGGGNPMQMMNMLQQVMNGRMNPQQAMGQIGGQIKNLSVDEYNKQVLSMATQFDQMYGARDGSITNILLNSGLTVNQLNQAILMYKQQMGSNG